VDVQEVSSEALEDTFLQFSFSKEAAASYVCMTRRVIDGKTDTAETFRKGRTSLEAYVASVLGG